MACINKENNVPLSDSLDFKYYKIYFISSLSTKLFFRDIHQYINIYFCT